MRRCGGAAFTRSLRWELDTWDEVSLSARVANTKFASKLASASIENTMGLKNNFCTLTRALLKCDSRKMGSRRLEVMDN